VRADVGIWGKLTRVVWALLLAAGVLALWLWYLPLFQQNERMRKEIMRLDALIQKKTEEGRHLKASLEALEHDPQALERLLREQLGYAKPGETVIRFESPPVGP